MNALDAVNPEYKKRIEKAINESAYRWRTARGIAKDAQLDVNLVLYILETNEQFLRARNPNARGQPVFTTRQHYMEKLPLSKKMLAAVTNELPEI
jgi:hypothetical protein